MGNHCSCTKDTTLPDRFPEQYSQMVSGMRAQKRQSRPIVIEDQVTFFETRGIALANDRDFPQATFCFFKHRMLNLSGRPYAKFDSVGAKCGKSWQNFPTFLEENYQEGRITSNVTWSAVRALWEKDNQKPIEQEVEIFFHSENPSGRYASSSFAKLAHTAYSIGKWGESYFWYRQHKRFYPAEANKIGISILTLDRWMKRPGWVGFQSFLDEKEKLNQCDEGTEWEAMLKLWALCQLTHLMCTFNFQSHAKDPWGLEVRFMDPKWSVSVHPKKQADRLGVTNGLRVAGRNGAVLGYLNRERIKKKLCRGSACEITFRREDHDIAQWVHRELPQYSFDEICDLALKIYYHKEKVQKNNRS